MHERFRVKNLSISSSKRNENGLSFYIFKGEVFGVLGMDGEECARLINAISGIEKKPKGKIFIDGKNVFFSSIRAAQRNGIYLVQRESKLFPKCSVAENFSIIYKCGRSILLNKKKILNYLEQLSEKYGILIEPDQAVAELNVCKKHIFEMIVAAFSGAKLLVLDRIDREYSDSEYREFVKIVHILQSMGISFLIFHTDINMAYSLSDRVMLMRSGVKAGIYHTDEIKSNLIYRVLLGESHFAWDIMPDLKRNETVMEAFHLSSPGIVKDLNFRLNKGEVIGFLNEKFETIEDILLLLRGKYVPDKGMVYLEGKAIKHYKEMNIAAKGIRYVCRESARDNIFPDLLVEDNLGLEIYKKYSRCGIFLNKRMSDYAVKRNTGLVLTDEKKKTPIYLLGHNERILIALYRCIGLDLKVLLLNSPAMQAEVGLKKYIFSFITQIRKKGVGIIYSSPNTKEMMYTCDRVYMIKDGKVVRCLKGERKRNE